MTLLKKFKPIKSKKTAGLLSSFKKLQTPEERVSSYFKKKLVFKRIHEEAGQVIKPKKKSTKKKKAKKKPAKIYTCEECPLHNTVQSHCIQGDGPLTAPVLFVGEAPGRTEDKKNKVFCGPIGRLLREFLDNSDYKDDDFRLTNVIRCHPGLDNKGSDNKPPAKAISHCFRFLQEEIKNMPNLKVIVPLGAPALKAVTGKTGITAWSGQRLASIIPEAKDIPVIPNFHPSYINRNENEQIFAQYLQDLVDVHDEFVKGEKEEVKDIERTYTLVDSLDKLDSMLEYLKKFDVVAFDVETHGVFPFHEGEEILTLSFAGEPGIGYCVPYMHKDATWSVLERKKVHSRLKKFLESDRALVAHNAQFDCMQLYANFDTVVNNVIADTMLFHYTLDETKGTHGLERLAYVYTDMGGYDEPLNKLKAEKPSLYDPSKGGSYNNVPLDILSYYSTGDSDCCIRLYYVLGEELEQHEYSEDLTRIANYLMTYAADGLTNVQNNGAHIDLDMVNFLDNFYLKKMKNLIDEMIKIPEVVEFITDRRRKAKAEAKAEEDAKIAAGKKKIKRKKKKVEEFEFNADSHHQIRELFFGYIGLQPVKETDKGELSTDEEVLEALSGQHLLVDLVSDYRSTSKLHGTYVKSVLHPKGKRPALLSRDGCLRSSYMLHGTTTGRLCVAGDTLLETSLGSFHIKDLSLPEDITCLIRTHTGNWRQILKRYYKGKEAMYAVSTNVGSIKCTKGHSFYTRSGWKRLRDLKVVDKVFSLCGETSGSLSKQDSVLVEEEITSIDYVGVEDVWDIEVEEDHSYVAHGFVNHNSSRLPNLQNIPRSGDIKKMFVSRFGDDGVIMEADYSQIELRIVAMLSDDETMTSVYTVDGGDIHMETACSIFNSTPEELEGDKEKRSIAKKVNFGICYGTGAQGLVGQLKKEGIYITKNNAQSYIDSFYEKYLGVGRWIEQQERFTVDKLISISPYGRIRHLPQAGSPDNYLRSDALRAAINHPVQSAASDCTLMSLSKLSQIFRKKKYKSKIILTVHDSIIFDVHKSELEEIAKLVVTVMESVKDWVPEFIPGLDTSWITLPVKVDIEIGKNWKELEEYKLVT